MNLGNTKVKVACPHCGFINNMFLENCSIIPKLVYCNLDDGGCDEPFVFAVKARVFTEVKTAAIDLNFSEPEPAINLDFSNPEEDK